MIERYKHLAERTAESASRRQFLQQFGRGAMTVAGVLGGLLALPRIAAAGPSRIPKCCFYLCTSADGSTYGLTQLSPCGKKFVNNNGDPCVLSGKGPCGR
jgi:hypothetical protein